MSQDESLGGVFMHLYHSQRTIQVQGSASMPDSSKAAVWFTYNCLVNRLKDLANIKKYEINSLNNVFRNTRVPSEPVSDKNYNNCNSCNSIFNLKRKSAICTNCGLYFHKTCLKDHQRNCVISDDSIIPTEPPMAPTTIQGPIFTPVQGSALTSVRGSAPRLPHSEARGVTTEQITPPLHVAPPPHTVDSTRHFPTNSGQALDTLVPSSLVDNTTNNQRKSKSQNKRKNTAPDELNTVFLKRELSLAQTRIVAQDAEIKDKCKRVEILLAQLKNYEERENRSLYDKYFPNDTPRNRQDFGQCSSSRHSQPQQTNTHPCHNLAHDLNHCICRCNCSAAFRAEPSQPFDREEVIQLIHSLKADHEEIKRAFISSAIGRSPPSQPVTEEATNPETQNLETDRLQNNMVSDEVLDEDLSINSIEYLIPDDPIEEANLNS